MICLELRFGTWEGSGWSLRFRTFANSGRRVVGICWLERSSFSKRLGTAENFGRFDYALFIPVDMCVELKLGYIFVSRVLVCLSLPLLLHFL